MFYSRHPGLYNVYVIGGAARHGVGSAEHPARRRQRHSGSELRTLAAE